MSSGGASAAWIIDICSGLREHLPLWLTTQAGSIAPADLATDGVFEACLDSFASCTHLILELDYFDLDSRSNSTATLGVRHKSGALQADRATFLRAPDGLEHVDSNDLGSVLGFIDGCQAAGYIVLVPDPTGPVGRSIVPSPDGLNGVSSTVDLVRQVRTTVAETVNLLGSRKSVSGVPFMQQDGNLLTCAHVAAWMTHYAAVLRGLAARRSSVQFHHRAASGPAPGRTYPSGGLTPPQITNALEAFGLPAEDLTVAEFDTGGRLATWYDRDAIWLLTRSLQDLTGLSDGKYQDYIQALEKMIKPLERLQANQEEGPGDEKEHIEELRRASAADELLWEVVLFWIRDTLTRTVCQYLNSGFPAVVLGRGHAKVLTGYVRRSEVTSAWLEQFEPSPFDAETDVVGFVAADDQVGPYVLESVTDILQQMVEFPEHTRILIPLPQGIWVRANDAEDLGAKVFAGSVRGFVSAAERNPRPYRLHCTEDGLGDVLAGLSELAPKLTPGQVEPTNLSLRSFVVSSTDYKHSFCRRSKDPVAKAQVRAASLPKFVWVVEVLDRERRKAHKVCTLGEVVLDATDTDLREANAYIVHIPGAIQVRGRSGAGRWHVSGHLAPYESGRYHGHREAEEHADLAGRWKKTLA